MNNLFDIACNFSSERFDKDLNEALRWYRESAARGNARAQKALARLE